MLQHGQLGGRHGAFEHRLLDPLPVPFADLRDLAEHLGHLVDVPADPPELVQPGVTTLDRVVYEQGLKRVDLIKIDAGAKGTFVADCRITASVRAPWLNEWMQASQAAKAAA